jgi:LPXTG-site transpeptidase (sortase) family protein
MRGQAFHTLILKACGMAAFVLVFFSLLLYHGTFTQALTLAEGDPEAQAQIIEPSAGTPERLLIPAISVDANIEPVALTTQGLLDVPQDPMNAGWYMLGTRPGEVGSAVIDGHVNWFNGATGVFKNLKKVKPGEVIMVQAVDGTITSFIIREVRVFRSSSDTTEIFNGADGQAHLNLITCNGVWDKRAGQYAERLVVFADKAP